MIPLSPLCLSACLQALPQLLIREFLDWEQEDSLSAKSCSFSLGLTQRREIRPPKPLACSRFISPGVRVWCMREHEDLPVCNLYLCLHPCVSCYLFPCKWVSLFLSFLSVNPRCVSFILPALPHVSPPAPIFLILPHVSLLTPSFPSLFSPSVSLLPLYPFLHLCFEVTTRQTLSNRAS